MSNQKMNSLKEIAGYALDDFRQAWKDVKKGIMPVVLIGALAFGAHWHFQQVSQAHQRGRLEGKVDFLMDQYYQGHYGVGQPMSDPVAIRDYEMRRAFLDGIMVHDPYGTTPYELSSLVTEGQSLRSQYTQQVASGQIPTTGDEE